MKKPYIAILKSNLSTYVQSLDDSNLVQVVGSWPIYREMPENYLKVYYPS